MNFLWIHTAAKMTFRKDYFMLVVYIWWKTFSVAPFTLKKVTNKWIFWVNKSAFFWISVLLVLFVNCVISVFPKCQHAITFSISFGFFLNFGFRQKFCCNLWISLFFFCYQVDVNWISILHFYLTISKSQVSLLQKWVCLVTHQKWLQENRFAISILLLFCCCCCWLFAILGSWMELQIKKATNGIRSTDSFYSKRGR